MSLPLLSLRMVVLSAVTVDTRYALRTALRTAPTTDSWESMNPVINETMKLDCCDRLELRWRGLVGGRPHSVAVHWTDEVSLGGVARPTQRGASCRMVVSVLAFADSS